MEDKIKFTRKTKVCSKCGVKKVITAFYKNKCMKNGRQADCKECYKVQAIVYYKNNKDKKKAQAIVYYEKNKDKRKVYYEENKDKIKVYYENNKDKHNAQMKVYNKNFAFYDTYASQIDWCEKVRRDNNNPKLMQVKCALCQKWFNPINRQITGRINAVNGKMSGDHNLYCSDACKKACPVFKKQKYRVSEQSKNNNARPDQGQFRDAVISCAEYRCEICGKVTDEGHAHHIESILYSPLESMDINNGIYVCKDCHKRLHSDINCSPVHLRCKSN